MEAERYIYEHAGDGYNDRKDRRSGKAFAHGGGYIVDLEVLAFGVVDAVSRVEFVEQLFLLFVGELSGAGTDDRKRSVIQVFGRGRNVLFAEEAFDNTVDVIAVLCGDFSADIDLNFGTAGKVDIDIETEDDHGNDTEEYEHARNDEDDTGVFDNVELSKEFHYSALLSETP
jgi:hypothetical protein